MPSTSGRAASHPRRVDKLKFFHELKQLRDKIQLSKGLKETLDSTYSSIESHPPVSSGNAHLVIVIKLLNTTETCDTDGVTLPASCSE